MKKVLRVVGIALAIMLAVSCMTFAMEKPDAVEIEVFGFNGITAWFGENGAAAGINSNVDWEINLKRKFSIWSEDAIVGILGITPKAMVIGVEAYYQDTYCISFRYDGGFRAAVGYRLEL